MSDFDPSLEEVYDAILGAIAAAWGDSTEVEWPDDAQTGTRLSAGSASWLRVSLKHTHRDATTVSRLPGQQRLQSEGVVMCNIFVPGGKRGLVTAGEMGKVLLDVFEGPRAGPVWFSEAQPDEAGRDGAWLQYNVKAKFHYTNQR